MAETEQLSLFDTSFNVTYITKGQVQDWPLPAAESLEEAIDATRGFGLFLIFNQGILWGSEWDNELAHEFSGTDPEGNDVSLKVTDTYRYGELCE